MGTHRTWLQRVLGRGSGVRRDVDEEIRVHLQMRVEELIVEGRSPEEARTEALRRFGDLDRARRRLYTTARRSQARLRRREWLRGVGRDAAYAARQARGAPGFTLAAIGVLALGIGLTTSMFTLVDHVLLRALPFPRPQELVALRSVPSRGEPFNLTSMANWVDWRDGNTTLASTAVYWARDASATVDTGEDVLHVPARDVAGGFFETLRPEPLLGRAFTEAEAEAEADVVVVSEGFWRRVLGEDPDLDARALKVNARPVRVIGVVPSGQVFPGGTQIWVPRRSRPGSGAMRNNVNWTAIARLGSGVALRQAEADLSAIARGIMERDPEGVYSHGVDVEPLRDVVVADARGHLRLLMGAALFVLLVACANLAGLSLARARAREQEMAVRLALGAGRWRLLRQVVTEHVLLALAGGAVGIAGAAWTTRAVIGRLEATLPRVYEVGFDGRVAAAGLVAALASGILAGLLPALRASHGGAGGHLSGARGGVRGGRGLPGAVLVGCEVALAVLLVTGGGLLVRSYRSVVDRELGFDPGGVITAEVNLVSPEYRDPERALLYWTSVLDALEDAPGVQAVGVANWIPTNEAGTGWIDLADQPDLEAGAGYRVVSEGYFEALRIPLLEGRGFDDRDAPGAERTVVINERMAERSWPEGQALGRRVRARSMEQWYYESQGLEPWLTVVGVVGNLRQYGFEDVPGPEMYVLDRQMPFALQAMTVVARTASDPAGVAADVRERIRALDPSLAVEMGFLERRVADLLSVRRLFLAVLGTFALLALLLACLGVYGLLSFAVADGTRELAVRSVLGAPRKGIVFLTVRRVLPTLALGAAAGLAAAYGLSGFLRAQLVDVSPADPTTYVASAATLLGVAVLSALLPSLRAARIDPLEALREG